MKTPNRLRTTTVVEAREIFYKVLPILAPSTVFEVYRGTALIAVILIRSRKTESRKQEKEEITCVEGGFVGNRN